MSDELASEEADYSKRLFDKVLDVGYLDRRRRRSPRHCARRARGRDGDFGLQLRAWEGRQSASPHRGLHRQALLELLKGYIYDPAMADWPQAQRVR